MSLRIWLPLDGNLKNLGVSDIEVVNNGASINNSGKIGSCYHFGPSGSSFMALPKEIMKSFTTECSVAFWLKIKTWNISYATYFQAGLGSMPWTHYIFGFLRNSTNSTACFTISNGSSASNANYLTSTLELNKWYHVALTYKTGKCKIYLNGKLDHEYSTSIIPAFSSITHITLGACNNGSNYQTDCDMNDFRIYDHCLSATEVHEIAQGLVLHYKLDGNGFIDNIIPGTDNWLLWYKDSRWTASGNVLTYSAGSVSWVDADSPCIPWTDVENKTLTVSVDLRSDDFNYSSGSGFSLCFVRKASGPTATSYSSRRRECTPIHKTAGTVSTNWTTYSRTYTNFTDANFSNTYNGGGGDWFGLYLWNYTDKSIQVRNIKVEINNKPTSWCPNAADALYSTLGLGEAIVTDSSGYGHNGTITGNITTNSSTPRYNTSTNFPDSACSIGIGNLSTMIPEGIFTFNIWFKKLTGEWSSKSYETILGGPSGFELEAKVSSTNSPVLKYYSWGGGTTNYTLDEWHMLTMVRTTSNTKFYLDGELKLTGSAGSIPSGNYFIGAWSNALRQNYRGYLSDARIYCTPLLDTDIKLLYKTGMRVDNLGGVHTFEYIEDEEEEKNTLQGLLKTNEIEEYNGIAKIKKNKGWLSPNFIEM